MPPAQPGGYRTYRFSHKARLRIDNLIRARASIGRRRLRVSAGLRRWPSPRLLREPRCRIAIVATIIPGWPIPARPDEHWISNLAYRLPCRANDLPQRQNRSPLAPTVTGLICRTKAEMLGAGGKLLGRCIRLRPGA